MKLEAVVDVVLKVAVMRFDSCDGYYYCWGCYCYYC